MDESDRLYLAAKMYFEEGRKQGEVARALGIRQPEVSRLIKLAKSLGVVEIAINLPPERRLSRRLGELFPHLDEAIVTPALRLQGGKDYLRDELATRAAQDFREHVRSGESVAVSGGRTIAAMVHALREQAGEDGVLERLTVAALTVLASSKTVAISPAGLVGGLVSTFPRCEGTVLQFPDLSIRTALAKETLAKVETLLEEAAQAKHIYLGVGHLGSPNFASLCSSLGLTGKLEKLGAVGECGHQPYSAAGEDLFQSKELAPLRDRVLAVPLARLRELVASGKARITAIAGGPEKHSAVLGGLRAGIFNRLITDAETARFVEREMAREN
ncbi:MAG TPA: sugar-binding domain-containing protein [Planctomycetota bacterium]|nr:sugar-binding domain-containing protein [Planctomycetota bacterium]